MMEVILNDFQWSRMFMSFLKYKDVRFLWDVLVVNFNRFIILLLLGGVQMVVCFGLFSISIMCLDFQFQVIKIISIIVKNDDFWLVSQYFLVSQLRCVWVSEIF